MSEIVGPNEIQSTDGTIFPAPGFLKCRTCGHLFSEYGEDGMILLDPTCPNCGR